MYGEEYGIGFEEFYRTLNGEIETEECEDAEYHDYEMIADVLELDEDEEITFERFEEYLKEIGHQDLIEEDEGAVEMFYKHLLSDEYFVIGGFQMR